MAALQQGFHLRVTDFSTFNAQGSIFIDGKPALVTTTTFAEDLFGDLALLDQHRQRATVTDLRNVDHQRITSRARRMISTFIP